MLSPPAVIVIDPDAVLVTDPAPVNEPMVAE